jgi:hypothetical protein
VLTYHVTVTSGLQAVARLARLSPLMAVIEAPVGKAEQVAERQPGRYPSITQSHVTRTALRRVQLPAVQLVILPPTDGVATLLLCSNLVPPGTREEWRHVLDASTPLAWRNYQLTVTEKGRITWRLREAVRAEYRQRIARLITGRGGVPRMGISPYQLPAESARLQVLKLAEHLGRYPGLSGIRSDVFDLAQYSTKVWKSTHPELPFPAWPTMPYLPFLQPATAPLSEIALQPPSSTQGA